METPQLHPKFPQGPEVRRLLAELQTHPGWPLVLAWLEAAEAQAKVPVPITPADGHQWPFKRAWADGEAYAYGEIRKMLAIAVAIPGRMDGHGRVKPSEFNPDGEDDETQL